MKAINKPTVHFTHPYLINPTNPVRVNLIGAGGTGSHMLTALGKINHTLCHLGHPGLQVTLWDDDVITAANTGRQLFADSEIGLPKADVLIRRNNRFFGTNWKAITEKFDAQSAHDFGYDMLANVYVSCVDNVTARFEIGKLLTALYQETQYHRDRPCYWMDFGNTRFTGQVLLATIGDIQQPTSKKFTTVATLPLVTDEYKDLLQRADESDNTPSCSLAEAIEKQDLFINPALAQLGGSLLFRLFKDKMIEYRGFFLNLDNFNSRPIRITTEKKKTAPMIKSSQKRKAA